MYNFNMNFKYEFREMTDEEFKVEQEAFNQHSIESGNPPEKQDRYGYVATQNGNFVGASSGLVQTIDEGYGNYFYLTDLIVLKEYRKQGHGKKLLELLEQELRNMGIKYIWTWTAEFEAENFYKNVGYSEFVKFENFYKSGHARIGLIKTLG